MKNKFRSAYDLGPRAGGIDCSVEPSLTKKEFADECDINNIMAKYERTGTLDFVQQYEGRFIDASALDFHSAMNIVSEANSMFFDMPAHLRARFENDPEKFLTFMDDPRNTQEIVDMGLGTLKNPPTSEPGSPASASIGGEPASAGKGSPGGSGGSPS